MAEYSRQLTLYADDIQVCSGFRIRVQGKSTMTLIPDTWIISCYNISQYDASLLSNANSIRACGQNGSVLCIGQPFDFTSYWQKNNQVYQYTILDGDRIWRSVVNVTIASETPLLQALTTILNKTSPSFQTSVGRISEAKTARGYSFFGRTCDYLKTISQASDFLVYSFQNVLYMNPKQGTTVIKITDENMVDQPQVIDGGYILPMPVHGMFVGSSVSMESDSVNGTYRLIGYIVSADNSQGDWWTKAIIANEREVQT